MSGQTERRWHTPEEIAAQLGTTPLALVRLCGKHRIPLMQVKRGLYRLTRASADLARAAVAGMEAAPPEAPAPLTVPDVARITGLPQSKVHRMAIAGAIPSAKNVESEWQFDETEIRRWVRAAEEANHVNAERIAKEKAAARLEKIRASILPAHEIVANAMPVSVVTSGIYFLIARGTVIYVGQSRNVASRLMSHAARRRFDAWFWIPCPVRDLDAMERAYIDAMMPKLNRDWVTNRARKAANRK